MNNKKGARSSFFIVQRGIFLRLGGHFGLQIILDAYLINQ